MSEQLIKEGIVQHGVVPRPAFVASLGASVLVHAFALGILPPLTEILPWPAARALEVTLVPPQPLPQQAHPEPVSPQVAHVPAAPRRAVHKSRAAPAPVRVAEEAPAAFPSTDKADTPPPVASETKPVLMQEPSRDATVALAPVGGTEPANVTGSGQREAVASIKPGGDSIVPPLFNAAYLRNPPPRYPLAARLNGEQGTVTLKVLVTQQGLPGSVTLEKTSGFALLDAAALQTVRRWRFVPARVAQEPVEAWVIVPIVFRLEESS